MIKSELNRNERIQKPLGKLLLDARQAKNLTRKELAKLTGIGESSIVRYEKLGLDEEDGQHPPADKLALLCFYLNIRAQETHWACLPLKEFQQEQEDGFDDIAYHPAYEYLSNDYFHILKENGVYREALRAIITYEENIGNEDSEDNEAYSKEIIDHVKQDVKKWVKSYDNFERRMFALGMSSIAQANLVGHSPEDKELLLSPRNGNPISTYPNSGWFGRAEDQLSLLQNELQEIKQTMENKKEP